MPHETIQDGPNVSIHYGCDNALLPPRFFFYVQDERLMWMDGASRAMNSICQTFCEDGGGCYFAFNEGSFGFGEKVSREIMAEIWTRFGVPSSHVDALRSEKGWS